MAEGTRVGVLVPNLFLRVPRGRRGAGRRAHGGRRSPTSDAGCGRAARVVIADLDALGGRPGAGDRGARARRATTVLAFGPHVQGERLAAARAAGAVVLPRSVFLQRLPELLAAVLGPAHDR